jgi:hypothetical protein
MDINQLLSQMGGGGGAAAGPQPEQNRPDTSEQVYVS